MIVKPENDGVDVEDEGVVVDANDGIISTGRQGLQVVSHCSHAR